MNEFSLEKNAEKIHYGKTKEYFREVLSSYENGNFRSSIVMLWSVAVCDIIYKLQSLVDMYGDETAKAILSELTNIQSSNPKSSEWETKLIDEVSTKTNLLEPEDYENLRHLQQQRHLSAHPVLKKNRELHSPNKDTARSLIRNTLEGLLTKPPFYTQKIFDEFVNDLEDSSPVLNSDERIRRYLESRYFSRIPIDVEMSIFRSLWKLVFKLDNDDCERNRLINFKAIKLITQRNKDRIIDKITGEKDYFSNIASSGSPLIYFIRYLAIFPEVYGNLNEDAKVKIGHSIDTDNSGRIFGWFIKANLESHYDELLEWIESDDYPKFQEEELVSLLEINDSEEWETMFCKLMASYYGASRGYNTADERFAVAISPYLHLFQKESLEFLLQKIEDNDQTYSRGRSYSDHPKIKTRIDAVFGTDFDSTPYPRFWRRFEDEDS